MTGFRVPIICRSAALGKPARARTGPVGRIDPRHEAWAPSCDSIRPLSVDHRRTSPVGLLSIAARDAHAGIGGDHRTQSAPISRRISANSALGHLEGDIAAVGHHLRADPQEIIAVLGCYYEALGSIITSYGATLTSFQGDGLMVLVNAPMPCSEPALRAVQMAIEMQDAVQRAIIGWRSRGHAIGFGIGLAAGPATVGQIGYESRVEYTAIGGVVNLASRLCASAADSQILIDIAVADTVRGKIPLVALGALRLKGYDKQLAVYSVEGRVVSCSPEQAAADHEI